MKSLNDKIIGAYVGVADKSMWPRISSTWDVAQPSIRRSALAKEGLVRRIGRGLYDYPRRNASLNIVLSPDMDRVAKAVARRRGSNLQASGQSAANALGLSTQVPGKHVYLADAATGQFTVGKQKFTMKRVTPKGVRTHNKVVNPVFQAFYFIGKDGITDDVVRRFTRP